MMRAVVASILVGLVAPAVMAQPKRPQADVAAVLENARVVPGAEARLELKVTLPPKVHVQANKPSDPLFIPTVLTLDAAKDVAVEEIVYPASESLTQQGLKEPLKVFGTQFSIGVRIKVAADTAPGEIVVPARLRYQACDETTCYPPVRAEVKWVLQVGKS